MLKAARVVFEDDDVIVVDKPAGLLTMGTDTERVRTVYADLRANAARKRPPEKVFIVHRLDREASGLLVFAKTIEAKNFLQDQFKDHSAGRIYTALVEGRVKKKEFTIRSSLAENAAFRVYVPKNSKAGKPAVTHVRLLKENPKTSLLEIRLETGRKHQIRVHLAHAEHPIVGDKIYGGRTNPINRLALHGSRLQFRHPRTRQVMHFDSAPPASFG